ncbi:hypothetical protein OpiT1DRAFT_03193 [Opitutaceae bacterium TAV1]|nr:hypothetical protein OpiT1DRAFT_03193 [Opitutaceae bacterium TAV1]
MDCPEILHKDRKAREVQNAPFFALFAPFV